MRHIRHVGVDAKNHAQRDGKSQEHKRQPGWLEPSPFYDAAIRLSSIQFYKSNLIGRRLAPLGGRYA